MASDPLTLARAASAAHRWREACERFAVARSTTVGDLPPQDLERLATALFLRGQPSASVSVLTEAYESYMASGDTVGAARTAGWLALEMLESDELPSSLNWAARGVRLIERFGDLDGVSGRVAFVPAALGAMFVGDVKDALRRFDEIAAVADRSGDRELAALAALGRGKSLATIGATAEGLAVFDEVMAAVSASEVSPIMTCIFFRVVLDIAYEGSDLTRAERWTADFEEWCRSQPDLIAYTGQCHSYLSRLLLLRGRWGEASSAATLAIELLRAGDFTAGYVANHQLAELHRLRGEFRPADEHYRRAAATGWEPQPGWALLRRAEGAIEDAQTMIRRSVAGADEGMRRRLLPAVVEIELAAGDVTAARRAADDVIASIRSAPTPMLAAAADFAEAAVALAEGGAAAALEFVDRASEGWASLGVPYEVARCGVLRGRILGALGETEAAAEQFVTARAVFLELGARSGLTELNLITGERPSGTLTAREAEVLRLVSTGLTNRGIAGRLSLSEKTVARHLANIYGKLGLSSRSAATAYAYENGLI